MTFLRLPPHVEKSKKLEPVARVMCTTNAVPEVHEPRLGRMERQPVPRKTFTQNSENTLAVPAVLEGDDKIIRIAHQPAGSHAGLHRVLYPQVQHMVQENVG